MDRVIKQLAGKYKYAVAVALLGVCLMLLPRGGAKRETPDARGIVQSEMEATLAAFDGVGRLRLMLTGDAATQRWTGAVIVCEGGDSAAVRLELTQAVRALTGLSADKIAVIRGRP
ncbi:MAG: hypothetical protein IKN81_10870 [Oscillospiraceae bacterium]|nr:hypothetical protein [Oscillospiraceae bacterium]